MSAVGELLEALKEVLAVAGVRWYLFGAQAVSVRAAPRATQDVDVTVAVDRRALPALIGSLSAHGFHHRFPEIADELVEGGAVIPLVHAPTALDLDLVVAGSGLEALVLSRATLIGVDGVTVPVASATDLLVLKLLAGRGKDLDDAAALLATRTVDAVVARDLLGQLEEALGQSDLLPRLDALLRR